jgi:Family of unknown function (DUF6498)
MVGMTAIPSLAVAWARPHRFFFPSTVLVLVADLIPLAGILWWDWDAFVLLMLYWMETAVIAFWALARVFMVAGGPYQSGISFIANMAPRLGLTFFFLVHASGFMGAHLLFLWVVFSGKWGQTIHNPHDFIHQMVLPYHLWVPLGMTFVARGIAFVRDMLSRRTLGTALAAATTQQQQNDAIGGIVGGLYGRIILMHITILAGVGVAKMIGSIGPYVLLIAIKTAFDVLIHVSTDLGVGKPDR